MKRKNLFFLLLLLPVLMCNCKKDDNKTEVSVLATEGWDVIMNNDTLSYGHDLLEKKSDGIVYVKGSWHVSGTDLLFQDGIMTINDTLVSLTAQGIATNPSAPAGFTTSTFTVSMTGSAHNGISYATWNVSFVTFGWPPTVNGTAYCIRKTGNGITH
jgi:hypothetical protein